MKTILHLFFSNCEFSSNVTLSSLRQCENTKEPITLTYDGIFTSLTSRIAKIKTSNTWSLFGCDFRRIILSSRILKWSFLFVNMTSFNCGVFWHHRWESDAIELGSFNDLIFVAQKIYDSIDRTFDGSLNEMLSSWTHSNGVSFIFSTFFGIVNFLMFVLQISNFPIVFNSRLQSSEKITVRTW